MLRVGQRWLRLSAIVHVYQGHGEGSLVSLFSGEKIQLTPQETTILLDHLSKEEAGDNRRAIDLAA